MAKKKEIKNIDELLQEALIPKDEQPYEIPSNWEWVRFNDVCEVRDGTHDSPKYIENGYPLITSKNLKNHCINYENVQYISKEDLDKINMRSKVEKNDILYAMIGTIGNPVLIDRDSEDSYAIKNVALFKSGKTNYFEYILFFLRSGESFKLIEKKLKGSTQKFIALGELRKLPFPLPPLSEQIRIVNKLEATLSKLKEAKEKIAEAKESFELRRASILHKAFTGELTKQWREEKAVNSEELTVNSLLEKINEEKIKNWEEECKKSESEGKKKPSKPKLKTVEEMKVSDDEKPYDLPQGWEWVRLGDVYDCINDKYDPIDSETMPYIGLENLKKGGGISEISNSEELKSTKTMFKKGDVLYGKLRPYLDKHSYVEFDGICSTDILCYRGLNSDMAKTLDYYFGLPRNIEYATANSSGINLPRVSSKIINELLFPLCSFDEQQEIVARIEALLKAEEDTKELLNMQEQIDLLEKSILAKAFRGELGTGDPSDEPALELLKRVLGE